MAKWARIKDSVVVEIVSESPVGKYHPSLVWVNAPNNVEIGWGWTGAEFQVPVFGNDEIIEIMKDAIRGKEAQKNERRIEHPNIAGSFFKWSARIERLISRSEDLANTDPIPTN